jgi:hypothetical protein
MVFEHTTPQILKPPLEACKMSHEPSNGIFVPRWIHSMNCLRWVEKTLGIMMAVDGNERSQIECKNGAKQRKARSTPHDSRLTTHDLRCVFLARFVFLTLDRSGTYWYKYSLVSQSRAPVLSVTRRRSLMTHRCT